MAAFFLGEVGVHPLRAKPGLLFSPAQAFLNEDLAHAAAFDGELLVFVQVGGKPVQAPAPKGQRKVPGPAQRGGHHLRSLLGRVGRRSAPAGGVFQRGQAARVKAFQPMGDGAPVELELGGDDFGRLALQAAPHDRRAFDEARFGLAAARQLLDGGTLGGVHITQRKHLPKTRGFHPTI
jgi:hypothetical protein